MSKSHSDSNHGQHTNLAVQARWAVGPTTSVWRELWLRILADVLREQEGVSSDAATYRKTGGPALGRDEESGDAE